MLEVKYSTTKKLLFISSQSQRRYGLIDDDIRTLLKYLMHNISIICYATLFHLVSVSNEKKLFLSFVFGIHCEEIILITQTNYKLVDSPSHRFLPEKSISNLNF